MEHKPWLSYINLIALTILVFICIAVAIVGGDSWIHGGVEIGLFLGMFPVATIVFAAIVVIGFLAVLVLNFSTGQRGKSGWIILVTTFLFIPVAFCLISLGLFASLTFLNK